MGKSLLLNLILNGSTTAGFEALAGKLSSLGEALDQFGGKVRGFEENSLETYKNYETYMLEARGALTAQYESESELARVMEELHNHAQEWAASTIFDTHDVAKAISEAAHAGWDYEQMIEGIPQAMLLAQAGNIDLAAGLDYVIKALNATGTEFEYAGVFIDQWVKAANSGATTVSELGEAIIRMGGTSQFSDSTAEMFTMLAVLADIGTTGSDAGTALRNSMIRLVAPTDKAAKAMATLGATQEETQSALADSEKLNKANELLESVGFSAYDSNGELKPFLDTYKDLYAAISGMSEVDRNAILNAIFPTRTIATAMGILEAAATNYDNLYQKILGSKGYAQQVADIQTSGLMGTEKEFESKVEEFSRKIGEILSPDKIALLDWAGDFADDLNSLPEEKLEALVGAMNTIAIAGPGLAAAGAAIKLFTGLGTIAVGAIATAMALNAIARSSNKIAEIDFESAFGNLELGLGEIGEHIDAIDTKFDLEQSAISTYAQALATAEENYLNLTSTLSEDLLSTVLTGRTLTEAEIAELNTLGAEIITSVRNGIDNAKARDLTFIDMLFGDMSTPEEADAFKDAANWIDSRYADLYAQAEALGQGLREAMTSALTDGELNEQERQAIQAYFDRQNQIMAEINARKSEEDFYAQMHRAQSVSWDTVETFLADNAQKQAEQLAATDEMYHQMYGQLYAAWKSEYDKAGRDAERKAREEQWGSQETEFNREWQQARDEVSSKYGDVAFAAFDALMNDSGYAEVWGFLKRVQQAGGLSFGEDGTFPSGFDYNALLPEGTSYTDMVDMLIQMSRRQGEFDHLLAPYGGYGSVQTIGDMYGSAYGIAQMLADQGYKLEITPEINTDELTVGLGEEETTLEVVAVLDATAVDEYNAPDKTAYVNYYPRMRGGSGSREDSNPLLPQFAEGGRAAQASIFGEAGPEWAIPEEHSERTAQLLNQARAASGFTWGDLISRFGGLGSGTGRSALQLTYAPTIHAGSASGVEQVLLSDKDRLMRMIRQMIEEMEMRQDAEVYI